MKNKKVLVIVGLILSIVLLFGLTGCDKDPAITQVQNDVATLQANIATINTNIANLQTSIAGIQVPDLTPINNSITTIQSKLTTLESNLTALQNSLNNPNSYATKAELNIITGDLAALANDVSAINTDLEALTEVVDELETRVDNLADDVDELSDFDLSEIEEAIVDLLERVSNLEDTVEAINIEDYSTDIDTLYANDVYLQSEIVTLQGQINTYTGEQASIVSTGWVALNTYQVNCRINKTGNYAVILTIYGNGVDGIAINPLVGYEFTGLEKDYSYGGTPKTMRTFILFPDSIKVSGTTTTLASQWVAGQTFSVQLVGGTIDCINIDTAVR